MTTTEPIRPTRPKRNCLPDGYSLSFSGQSDSLTDDHDPATCRSLYIPFRTSEPRGVLYSHASDDGRYYIVVYLRRGFLNVAVRDSSGQEKEIELDTRRVDDSNKHILDIKCESGELIAYLDRVPSKRIDLYSSIYLDSYTLGYYDAEKLPAKFSSYDSFRGCLEQVLFNGECLIDSYMADPRRFNCPVQPAPPPETTTVVATTKRQSCVNMCASAECVVEINSRGFLLYRAREAGAQIPGENSRDSIRVTFMITSAQDQDQELLTVHHTERQMRFYVSGGQVSLDVRGQTILSVASGLNDGKWHRLFIEQSGQEVSNSKKLE